MWYNNINDAAMMIRSGSNFDDDRLTKLKVGVAASTHQSKLAQMFCDNLINRMGEFAAGIAVNDQTLNKGFKAHNMQLIPNTTMDADKFVDSSENIVNTIKAIMESVNTSKVAGMEHFMNDSALPILEKFSNNIKANADNFKENKSVGLISLDSMERAVLSSMNDALNTDLGSLYTGVTGTEPVKFEKNNFVVGNRQVNYTAPSSVLQTYYRMITVVVARPILVKPPMFTQELVDYIPAPEEVINDDRLIQYVLMKDSEIGVDAKPIANQSTYSIATELTSRSTEATGVQVYSTQIISMEIDKFGDYISRMYYARTVAQALAAIISKVEEIIQDYIMDFNKFPQEVVASGRIGDTASNPASTTIGAPYVKYLTGVDIDGGRNGTMSEQDIAAILSAIDMNDSGSRLRYALIHPQAITTLLTHFSEKGYTDNSGKASGNASIFNPIIKNAQSLNDSFKMGGMGMGGVLDVHQNPGLYGFSGIMPSNGILPDLINGLNPTTADINLESDLWKQYRVKVGSFYELVIIPYAKAPVRMADTDVRDMIGKFPTMIVNGMCETDIYLINPERTAILVSTGPVQHNGIENNAFSQNLAIGFQTKFKLYPKPFRKMYVLKNVKVAINYAPRALTIRNI